MGYATVWLIVCQVILLVILSGCGANLPHYAKPRGQTIEPSELSGRDLIAYRELSPGDFRAAAPPEEMRPYAQRMGAVTCANVLTFPEPEYYVEETASGYAGAYLHLGFVARMDRNCSWWNPSGGPIPEDYVLQHEQIHFALAESAARRLNQAARKFVAKRFQRSTEKEVHQALHEVVEDLMDDAVQDLVRRNRKFDQDTSNTYAPEVQQRWFDTVMTELGTTE